jgi:protein-L-isoaspartate(D-aspartate) O-methyltransferase
MRENLAFLTPLHKKTHRDYVARVARGDKAECAEIAKQFGRDYWDGDRKYGYGGYHYDGRWAGVATSLIRHYGLSASSRVLDVGCGKAFLLYEIMQQVAGIRVAGVDVSEYGIENARPEVRPFLRVGRAEQLEFEDKSFDLVLSLTTLHNLLVFDLATALGEITRVTNKDAYVAVESYRSESEKANLLAWQLTCQSFYTPEEWVWMYERFGYAGDYEFIYFE